MKTRNGFVSNSSAASFMVIWKSRKEDISNVKEALSRLFDLWISNDGDLAERDWNDLCNADMKYMNKDLLADAIEIMEHTTEKNGKFETRFYTSMFNDINDFGEAAKSLVTALLIKDRYWHIVYSDVNSDDYDL